MAGLEKQDLDFWDYVKEFDFVSLCETLLEENRWNNIKGLLPGTHDWVCNFAKKEKKRGREPGEGFL